MPVTGCPAVAVKIFGAGDSDDPDVSTPAAAADDSQSPGGTGGRLDRQKGFQQLVQTRGGFLSCHRSFFSGTGTGPYLGGHGWGQGAGTCGPVIGPYPAPNGRARNNFPRT